VEEYKITSANPKKPIVAVVGRNLPKGKAKSLADSLNDKQSVNEDLSTMYSYVVSEDR
jgi:hypothetical protein